MAKGGSPSFLFTFLKVLHHRLTVFAVTALLAILVLWQTGTLVWKLWQGASEAPKVNAAVQSFTGRAEPETLQNLVDYPLIQTASMQAAQGAASLDAPETSLQLKLVGLVYSTDESQARAIIESAEQGALSYSTRERVADNVEIYSIAPDRVILLHAGLKEALFLDPDNKAPGASASAGAQPAGQRAGAQAAARQPAAPGQSLMSPPRNTAELMREFSATPVMEDGELLGFQLKALRNPAILQEFGIGPEDVVTAVNGIALNSPGRVMVLYDKLKRQREFEITLSSGGSNRTITVNLYE